MRLLVEFLFDCLWFGCFCPVGQDIRDRFSGAVEAFSRRNATSSGRHGEQSRHRTSEDVPSSKDVVFVLPHSMEN